LAAAKDKEVPKSNLHHFAQLLQYIPGGALLFAVVPLLILGYFGWYYWGAEHLDKALYAVRIENLETTPQPTWIRTSKVREEVFQNGGLGQLSLLDPQASATIAHAFESHSWVQQATRVTKLAGGKVTVDLIYRRPIAMVHYEGSKSADPNNSTRPGFYPVDESGVVLPTSDFDESQVWNYLLIYAEGATAPCDIGMAYSDGRIRQALSLCRLLEPNRIELRLEGVYVVPDDRLVGTNGWLMWLRTADNKKVRWGHAPGFEVPGEANAQFKLAKLVQWIERGDSSIQLDLLSPSSSEKKLISGPAR
jgi:hypothetical protein